MTNPIQPINSD